MNTINKPYLLLGIDPDVSKSGVACWNQADKKFEYITTMDFFDLLDLLKKHSFKEVVIEASWLISRVVYGKFDKQAQYKQMAISKAVGANRQIGKLLELFCKKYNISYRLVKPTSSKVDAETFKNLTKWEGRTNSEERDSALLIFGL